MSKTSNIEREEIALRLEEYAETLRGEEDDKVLASLRQVADTLRQAADLIEAENKQQDALQRLRDRLAMVAAPVPVPKGQRDRNTRTLTAREQRG